MLVPGLLQTASYARVLVQAAMPRASAGEVEAKVAARIGRADLFDAERRPTFWAILDESLIRRRALPAQGMAELLEHILTTAGATRSILQIVPETSASHPFMMGMTRTMTFADAPPVVYAESLHSGQLIDYPALGKDYRESYDLLRAAALSPGASLAMIQAAAANAWRSPTESPAWSPSGTPRFRTGPRCCSPCPPGPPSSPVSVRTTKGNTPHSFPPRPIQSRD
jgi:hypothetical protein